LKDEYELITKTLVELTNPKGEVGGYMVVDHEQDYEIVEFALGDVHPLQNVSSKDIYYLGPIAYAGKVNSTELKDLKTNLTFNKSELNNIIAKKEAHLMKLISLLRLVTTRIK